ncbi:MAG: hypothetical protein Q8M56_13260, partial [Desulfobacterales bacterium]|nr:hypothetical protein [Desulfobacterales bacterium]
IYPRSKAIELGPDLVRSDLSVIALNVIIFEIFFHNICKGDFIMKRNITLCVDEIHMNADARF